MAWLLWPHGVEHNCWGEKNGSNKTINIHISHFKIRLCRIRGTDSQFMSLFDKFIVLSQSNWLLVRYGSWMEYNVSKKQSPKSWHGIKILLSVRNVDHGGWPLLIYSGEFHIVWSMAHFRSLFVRLFRDDCTNHSQGNSLVLKAIYFATHWG